jgi:hypothetical protein
MPKGKPDLYKRQFKGKFRKCKCGCGEIIPYLNSANRFIKYKLSHNLKKFHFKGGQDSPRWKGGKITMPDGYVRILVPNNYYTDHSSRFIYKSGYMMEHRLVWEQYHNVCLLSWAHVHHKNGIKYDNKIENLEAMMEGKHAIIHLIENNFHIGKRDYSKSKKALRISLK